MKTLYDVLEVAPDASHEEIKQAFRRQIARYHPDKVQHLGAEFQVLAATRASELTEAYSVLTNSLRRSEYDRKLRALDPDGEVESPAPAPAHADEPARPRPTPPRHAPRPSPAPQPGGPSPSADAARPGPSRDGPHPEPRGKESFVEERASRDELVRKASVARMRIAIQAEIGACDEYPPTGFDVAANSRIKLFVRTRKSKVLGRFVSRIDGNTIADTFIAAARLATADTQFSVFLMGIELASSPELAEAVAQQRRRTLPGGPGSIVLIPVDVRDWSALVPTDTPKLAKSIIDRLRAG